MSHSYTKIWLHVVFSTKNRSRIITGDLEKKLHWHLKGKFTELGSPALAINGMEDHIHALFLLNPHRLAGDVINAVKKESSNWINQNDLTLKPFSWENGFGCFSVSESMVPEVESYIKGQKNYHQNKNFDDEFTLMLKKYKLS